MARQSKQSAFLAKLGAKGIKAHEEHKSSEVEFDTFGDLPPGINGGVAQLKECKLDTYSKGDMAGEYYFLARGVVVSPVEHEGLHVQGLSTMIMEPICETPGRSRESVSDHLKQVYNELKKLGLEIPDDIENLEPALEALKEVQPYFTFRTWQGAATEEFPNPRVNHSWSGAINYNGETESSQGVNDTLGDIEDDDEQEEEEEEEEEEKEEQVRSESKKPTKKRATRKKKEPEPEFDEFNDLYSIAEKAEDQDEEAQEKLENLAKEAGIPQTEIDDADTWKDLVDMIQLSMQTESESTEDDNDDSENEEEEFEPQVEDVYNFRPPNSKGVFSKRTKPIEVEVIKVNKRKRTCDVRDLSDLSNVFKGLPWSRLETA